ncbi:hypothetical protein J6590_007955 [Homalodisca vitripennis]|nr:hypothetical protein J6590_007955 [Homalodisca vitripennis]
MQQKNLGKKGKSKGKALKRKNQKKYLNLSSTDDESDYSLISSGHSDMVFSSEDEEQIETVVGPEEVIQTCLQVGNFVAVEWNGLRFPGIVVQVSEEGAVVECMERTRKFWKWPAIKDSLSYKWCSIRKKIQPPKVMKRGLFSINDL